MWLRRHWLARGPAMARLPMRGARSSCISALYGKHSFQRTIPSAHPFPRGHEVTLTEWRQEAGNDHSVQEAVRALVSKSPSCLFVLLSKALCTDPPGRLLTTGHIATFLTDEQGEVQHDSIMNLMPGEKCSPRVYYKYSSNCHVAGDSSLLPLRKVKLYTSFSDVLKHVVGPRSVLGHSHPPRGQLSVFLARVPLNNTSQMGGNKTALCNAAALKQNIATARTSLGVKNYVLHSGHLQLRQADDRELEALNCVRGAYAALGVHGEAFKNPSPQMALWSYLKLMLGPEGRDAILEGSLLRVPGERHEDDNLRLLGPGGETGSGGESMPSLEPSDPNDMEDTTTQLNHDMGLRDRLQDALTARSDSDPVLAFYEAYAWLAAGLDYSGYALDAFERARNLTAQSQDPELQRLHERAVRKIADVWAHAKLGTGADLCGRLMDPATDEGWPSPVHDVKSHNCADAPSTSHSALQPQLWNPKEVEQLDYEALLPTYSKSPDVPTKSQLFSHRDIAFLHDIVRLVGKLGGIQKFEVIVTEKATTKQLVWTMAGSVFLGVLMFGTLEEHSQESQLTTALTEQQQVKEMYREIARSFLQVTPGLLAMQSQLGHGYGDQELPIQLRDSHRRHLKQAAGLLHLLQDKYQAWQKVLAHTWLQMPNNPKKVALTQQIASLRTHIDLVEGLVQVHNLQVEHEPQNAQKLLDKHSGTHVLESAVELSVVRVLVASLLKTAMFMDRAARVPPSKEEATPVLDALNEAETAFIRNQDAALLSDSVLQDIRLSRAAVLSEVGQHTQAVNLCREVLATGKLNDSPRHFLSLLTAGRVLTADVTHRHQQRMRQLQAESRKEVEDSDAAHVQCGTAAVADQVIREFQDDAGAELAIRCLTRAMVLHPSAVLPYALRGRVLRLRGDVLDARKDLEHAIACGSQALVTDESIRGLLFLNLQEGRCEEARPLFDVCLLLAGADPLLLQRRRQAVLEFERQYGTQCHLSDQRISSTHGIPLLRDLQEKRAHLAQRQPAQA